MEFKKTIRRMSTIVIASLSAVATFQVHADDKVYRLKLAETWGPNTPILGDASKNMAKIGQGNVKWSLDYPS